MALQDKENTSDKPKPFSGGKHMVYMYQSYIDGSKYVAMSIYTHIEKLK